MGRNKDRRAGAAGSASSAPASTPADASSTSASATATTAAAATAAAATVPVIVRVRYSFFNAAAASTPSTPAAAAASSSASASSSSTSAAAQLTASMEGELSTTSVSASDGSVHLSFEELVDFLVQDGVVVSELRSIRYRPANSEAFVGLRAGSAVHISAKQLQLNEPLQLLLVSAPPQSAGGAVTPSPSPARASGSSRSGTPSAAAAAAAAAASSSSAHADVDDSLDDSTSEVTAEQIVELLNSSQVESVQRGAELIAALASQSESNGLTLGEAGAIESLVALLSVDEPSVVSVALIALAALLTAETNRHVFVGVDGLAAVSQHLHPGRASLASSACYVLSEVSASPSLRGPVGVVCAARVCALLDPERADKELMAAAASCVWSFCHENADNCAIVVACGGVQRLLSAASTLSMQVAENALGALCNLVDARRSARSSSAVHVPTQGGSGTAAAAGTVAVPDDVGADADSAVAAAVAAAPSSAGSGAAGADAAASDSAAAEAASTAAAASSGAAGGAAAASSSSATAAAAAASAATADAGMRTSPSFVSSASSGSSSADLDDVLGQLIASSGVELFLQLLSETHRTVTRLATWLLLRVSKHVTRLPSAADVVHHLRHSSGRDLEAAAVSAALLSLDDVPGAGFDDSETRRVALCENQAIPALAKLFDSADDKVAQFALMSAALLSNGLNAVCDELRELRVTPKLVARLSSDNRYMQEYACRLILNLCADEPKERAAVRAAGGIAPLVKLLSSPHASVVREASGALWNCTAGDAASVAEVAKEDGVSVLLQLLAVDYDEIAENCTGVLCNIVTDKTGRKAVLDVEGGVAALTAVLWHRSTTARWQAAGALVPLCGGSDEAASAAVEQRGFDGALSLLSQQHELLQERGLLLLAGLCRLDVVRDACVQRGMSKVCASLSSSDAPDALRDAAQMLMRALASKHGAAKAGSVVGTDSDEGRSVLRTVALILLPVIVIAMVLALLAMRGAVGPLSM